MREIVKRLETAKHDIIDLCEQMEDDATELRRLRAENEKLRAALKPFAEYSATFDLFSAEACGDEHKFCSGLTYGDLRSAAAALKETNNG